MIWPASLAEALRARLEVQAEQTQVTVTVTEDAAPVGREALDGMERALRAGLRHGLRHGRPGFGIGGRDSG